MIIILISHWRPILHIIYVSFLQYFFVCAFRLLQLFYAYLPIISVSSPHLLLPTSYISLCLFSQSIISLPPINLSYSLLVFLFPIHPYYLLFCISHCLHLWSFHSLLFNPSLLPQTSIPASISGAHTADGSGPLSPLREQKVCPLPLRLCVMEHREIETEEREQMGGGHTGCLFYNITPNNAVVISMTM